MAAADGTHVGCCIQDDTADVLRHPDNVQFLDKDKWTSRETAAVQPSAM